MDTEKNNEQCCVVSCDLDMGETYWNNQYNEGSTGWDLQQVSSPLKAYIDQLTNKQLRILIPGCGNTYEAEYLLQQGFTDITVIDIAPLLVEKLMKKFEGNPCIKIVLGDFFTHTGVYDLVLEQTFFCAISPVLRKAYAAKMKELLVTGGKLTGVLFDRVFEKAGPPFGGCSCEYKPLFENDFLFKCFDPCYNSHEKRKGTELFIILMKK